MKAKRKVKSISGDRYLDGQLLLAMPGMTDKRFRRAVIYMCRHSDEGAMGIIVNQRAKDLPLATLMRQLSLIGDVADEDLPAGLQEKSVHVGGPVASERGFVLHTSDVTIDDATLSIGDGICLTATLDILKMMAAGKGPGQAMLALGYSGWDSGQLESEIQANGWLHCPADRDLVFATDIEQTYTRALSKIGIDPTFLSGAAGHA